MRNIYNKIKEVFGKKKHTTIKRKYHNKLNLYALPGLKCNLYDGEEQDLLLNTF